MTKPIFELKVDLIRNIPFVLDAVIEIGVGLVMVSRQEPGMTLLIMGGGLITIGIIQFIRKIKTFHLTDTELIIRRPLFPFALAEDRFQVSKMKEIEFIRVKGRFGGPHLNIVTSDRAESFRIAATKENIDEFEMKLKALGLLPIRDDM